MPRKKSPARRRCDTDLTDAQWEVLAPLIPDARSGGRPRKATSRELVDAILYFLRAGVALRLLPHDLPPWQTPYYYLRHWQREGVWERIHHTLVLAASSGEGFAGDWSEDLVTSAQSKLVFMSVTSEAKAKAFLDALEPLLESHGLVALCSPVSVVRGAKFD